MTPLTSSNNRTLIAACSAIAVFGLAFGMTYPLLSLTLESRGVSPDIIGLNTAMMPVGILIFSPLIPRLSQRFGAKQIAIIASLATALCIVSYKLFDTLNAWFFIRILQGMSVATLFVISEAWIVGSATKKNRGKVVAIYTIVLSAAFGAGPALIGVIGTDGWTPYLIGAVSVALGAIPIAMIHDIKAPPSEHHSSGIIAFLPRAPMLIAAVACFSVFDAATVALFPVYGIENGLSQSTAAFALTALILGNIVLQYPIGWLADIYDARKMLIYCTVITTVLTVSIPWIINSWVLWPVLIIGGATGYGVYTLSLKSLGDRFSGQDLVNGTAAFGVMWGLGALLGSIGGGWSMTLSPTYGLPMALALIYALLASGLIIRRPAMKQDNTASE